MKQLFFLLGISLLSHTVLAQADTVFVRYNKNQFSEKIEYKTDTLLFEGTNTRQILHGTMVLPWTLNQQVAKGYGLYLDKVTSTECLEGRPDNVAEEIISIQETDSTFIVDIKIYRNCCHHFLCDVEIVNGNTINLIQQGYGAMYCGCECCFGMTYHFSKLDFNEQGSLQSIMINGKASTSKNMKDF